MNSHGGHLQFRLLTHWVRVTCADSRVHQALRFLVPDAEQSGAPGFNIHYRVTEIASGRFLVSLDGAAVGVGLEPDGVLDLIYTSVHEAVHQALPPHLRVHAGMATLGGRRVLFIGRKSSGKTTLMLQLLADGEEVHADEMALIFEDRVATPMPRRFHMRAGTFALISGLAALRPALPCQVNAGGHAIHSISPTEVGRPWRIFPAPVDDLVFIKPAHGQLSSLQSLDKASAARRLIRQATLPQRSVTWASVLLNLVHCSPTYLLYNGCPNESAALVRHVFSSSDDLKDARDE